MASDVVVRQGLEDAASRLWSESQPLQTRGRAEAEPANLADRHGAWEGACATKARRVMGELGCSGGRDRGRNPGGAFARRAIAVPLLEHVARAVRRPKVIAGGRPTWLGESFSASRLKARTVCWGRGSSLRSLVGGGCWCARCRKLLPEGEAPMASGAAGLLGARAGARGADAADPEPVRDAGSCPVLAPITLRCTLRFNGALVLAGAAWAGGLPARAGA